MPHKPKPHDRSLTTPAGQLAEAGLQQLVGYQLAQAAITTDAVFSAQVGTALGLRRVEYTILLLIRENPACSSARLARALGVTAPNITMWIDKLVQRGWVQRATSTTDRRANHLRLTPEGAALATDATGRLLAGEAQALAALSSGERAILLELLHKVAALRAAAA
jgi:DNA-binding MarR family transcriptional regulator